MYKRFPSPKFTWYLKSFGSVKGSSTFKLNKLSLAENPSNSANFKQHVPLSKVGDGVCVLVGVTEEVGVLVAVGVFVGVFVGLAVGVCVKLAVDVTVTEEVTLGVTVSDGVAVGVLYLV